MFECFALSSPGSTKNECTEEEGIMNLVECLNKVLKETKFVTIVIENMAGQGAVMGRTFEQLKVSWHYLRGFLCCCDIASKVY